jgi:DNA-binding response OmpR family regulator
MDVLIIERDELVGTMLADALADDGITAAVVPDERALALPRDDKPLVVITGMNRGHEEDLTGLTLVRSMRTKWPSLCAIYLASLWPVRLRGDALSAGDRFLAKPFTLAKMIRTVRELMCLASANSRDSNMMPSVCYEVVPQNPARNGAGRHD